MKDRHIVAAAKELFHRVPADELRTPNDENLHLTTKQEVPKKEGPADYRAPMSSACRKQSVVWSLTRPAPCI